MIDWAIFAVFVAYGVASWYYHISYRVSIAAGLLILLIAASVVALGYAGIGAFVAILAYYLLVIGVAIAIVDSVRKERMKRTHSEKGGELGAIEAPKPSRPRVQLSDLFHRLRPR